MTGGYSPLRRWLRELRAAENHQALHSNPCASCGAEIVTKAWRTPELTWLCFDCGFARFGWARSRDQSGQNAK